MRAAKLLLCLVLLCLAGCTVTMDNPWKEKETEEMKLVRQRIEAYELLDQEAALVLSITQRKAATEAAKKPPVNPDELAKLKDRVDKLDKLEAEVRKLSAPSTRVAGLSDKLDKLADTVADMKIPK